MWLRPERAGSLMSGRSNFVNPASGWSEKQPNAFVGDTRQSAGTQAPS